MGDTGMVSGVPDANSCSVPPARSRWRGQAGRVRAGADAAARQALDQYYRVHYRPLVRLAALLTGDVTLAEVIAADSLVALLACPQAARSPEGSLFHLRQQVVIRSRRVARARSMSRRGELVLRVPGWESGPVAQVLGPLSAHQREVIVLLHYLDLGENEAAALMGVSERSVRRFLTGAWQALQGVAGDGNQDCCQ
jgi:DNA-directed RNA polymerase specialized sigma24 family protein